MKNVKKKSWTQKVLCFLFARIYRQWLYNENGSYDTVDKVIGWRTARVRTKGGQVRCMSPCFWIFQ